MRYTSIDSSHTSGYAEIDNNNTRFREVFFPDHQVWLLDITVHHRLLMHKYQRFKALAEHIPIPILGKYALLCCLLLQSHEVASMIRKDLDDAGYQLALE
eukprot:CAMPEP_0169143480 /NCGR_PEP_ID=MMETSP1015-20121227/45620_1 /TAXON_ID=342587 /ORGANISM="Karlodinium micrum, Strain CCMP2283" /LENGTH=99 /DNA_ID=CAMNT_0009210445 /DNA_START=496 /DNA_END=795 /DNA_ORIENTATION=+